MDRGHGTGRVVVTIGQSPFVWWHQTATRSGKGTTRYIDTGLATVTTGGETSV